MKRLLAPAAFAAFALTLSAQTSVWKVTRGESTLYLGGTCHVLRAQDLPLPPEYDLAYAASKRVYFETDIERSKSAEMQQIVAREGVFADGRTLQKVLTPEAWAAVEKFCSARGIPPAQVQTMKPWLFVLMVTVIELQRLGVSQEGVDAKYFAKARADGRPIGQLETFEEQVAFITGMAGDKPSDFVLQGLADLDEVAAEFPKLLAAWRAGDLGELERMMNHELQTKYPELYRTLIVDRNNAWMKKIDALLASPEVEFVLAGAGHMSGTDGLVAQLRARGAKVEQVVAPKK